MVLVRLAGAGNRGERVCRGVMPRLGGSIGGLCPIGWVVDGAHDFEEGFGIGTWDLGRGPGDAGFSGEEVFKELAVFRDGFGPERGERMGTGRGR